jgi:hypothetical protein
MAEAPRLTASSTNESPSARPGQGEEQVPGTTLRLSMTRPEIGRVEASLEGEDLASLM